MSRIYGISDLHTDYDANLAFVENMPERLEDVLIVAGDISDDIPRLVETLSILKAKYKDVFFIPGNHELWLNNGDPYPNSLVKLYEIVRHCKRIGVHTEPRKVHCASGDDMWVVPLYSWYAGPDDDPRNSLYIPGKVSWKEQTLKEMGWSDAFFCKWPSLRRRSSGSGSSLAQLFAEMNSDRIVRDYDAPVISFSHFVPRAELLKATFQDELEIAQERCIMGLPNQDWKEKDFGARFNFSRVAGSNVLDRQIRKIRSKLHLYGHQHRNRDRVVKRVRYVSHCLGSPREQREGVTWGIRSGDGPKLLYGGPCDDDLCPKIEPVSPQPDQTPLPTSPRIEDTFQY